jgi:formamidopyrimidine-DNA glycosylase
VPELPEVETVISSLQQPLTGCRIKGIRAGKKALRRPWSSGWEKRLVDRRILGVCRRGKWIILELDRGLGLIFHLGMSGQLTVAGANQAVADHTHVVLTLDRGDQELRFRDARRFGSVKLLEGHAALDSFFDTLGLGPEPWDLEPRPWYERLAATTRCVKAVLLDQCVLAGVGNIYADESLFEARLHPFRTGHDLTRAEAERLRRAIITVLHRAIECLGTTFDSVYPGGGYKCRVYGQTGKPCPRCGTPIVRIRLAGRSTHYCPKCQKKGG